MEKLTKALTLEEKIEFLNKDVKRTALLVEDLQVLLEGFEERLLTLEERVYDEQEVVFESDWEPGDDT